MNRLLDALDEMEGESGGIKKPNNCRVILELYRYFIPRDNETNRDVRIDGEYS